MYSSKWLRAYLAFEKALRAAQAVILCLWAVTGSGVSVFVDISRSGRGCSPYTTCR